MTNYVETLKYNSKVGKYVSDDVVNYWKNTYGLQSNIQLATGPNGTYTVSDVIGYAAGYNSAAPLQQNKIEMEKLIESGAMDVFTKNAGSSSSDTGIYIVMDFFIAGAYDPIAPSTDYSGRRLWGRYLCNTRTRLERYNSRGQNSNANFLCRSPRSTNYST